jgi:type IV pilus assembly protein PilF
MMRRTGKTVLLSLSLAVLLLGCATEQGSKAQPKKMAKAHEQLGASLLVAKDYQGALKELLQALELKPDSADLGLKESNSAIVYFKKALQLKPDFPEAQNNLGTAYANLKQWAAAVEYFQAAANNLLYRTRHLAYDNLGAAYHNMGEYGKAVECYKKATEFFPEYGPAYINMGLAYEKLQEWTAAVDAYKKAGEVMPDSPVPHLQLGTLYLRLNRQEEAVQELLAAITNDPNGPFGEAAKKTLDELRNRK